MKNEVILICKDLNNKKIINKLISLQKEFADISFSIISYRDSKEYDDIIDFLPSWILRIGDFEDIVKGDVLITPLRSLIKERRKASNYVKK